MFACAGYEEKAPAEGPPPGGEQRLWTFTVDQITVDRYDRQIDSINMVLADCFELIDTPDYEPTVGVELISCPRCLETEHLKITGRWGDPLTFTCPGCGTTTTVTGEQTEVAMWAWSRHLMSRLILTEADPASRARTLLRQITDHHNKERRRREEDVWYQGPEWRDAEIAERTDLTAEDLGQALWHALEIRLPDRHGGRHLERLLVHVVLALTTTAVGDTDDGRRLAAAVRSLLEDVRSEHERMAYTRVPVRDQLNVWRNEGGPEMWQKSWDRTISLVDGPMGGYLMGEGVMAEGAAALTTALYVIARTRTLDPAYVTGEQVLALAAYGSDPRDVTARWEAHLRALGHDPDSPEEDPVAALWRRLRIDHTPAQPPLLPGPRTGPAVTDGMRWITGFLPGFFPREAAAA